MFGSALLSPKHEYGPKDPSSLQSLASIHFNKVHGVFAGYQP